MMIIRLIMRQLEWVVRSPLNLAYWVFLGGLGLLVFGFGSYGWLAFDAVTDSSGDTQWLAQPIGDWTVWRWADAVQRGGKLLITTEDVMNYPAKSLPWPLIFARFGGSIFFVLLAGRLFIFAIGNRVAQGFLWARAGHDVVMGDSDAAINYLEVSLGKVNHLCREAERTLGRKAELERTLNLKRDLRRAGAARARRIVVAEEGDGDTWATAQSVAVQMSGKRVEIIAHIVNPWLSERVSRADPTARLRPFSYATGAARQIMLAHPPFLLARAYQAAAQHILIIGAGDLGQALIREFLVTSVSLNPEPMIVTVVDEKADDLRHQFEALHPGLRDYADVEFLTGNLLAADGVLEVALKERCERSAICAVYVSATASEEPLQAAVGIKDRAERLGWFAAPIFVNSGEGSGLRNLAYGAGRAGDGRLGAGETSDVLTDLCLAPFGAWRNALDGAGLLSPRFDDQARMFHDKFRQSFGAVAKPFAERSPSEQDWDVLEEEFRVSNRRLASHIRAKLDAAGFDLGRWLEEGGASGRPSYLLPDAAGFLNFEGDSAKLDRLAELEHLRWAIDRTLNGWRYGVQRNNAARVHDKLVPNEALSEEDKEKDRNNIRESAAVIRALTKSK